MSLLGRLRRLARRRPSPHGSRSRWARVAPWLLVGPALDATGYRALAADGVTHVLDLRSESSDDPELMRSLGMEWLRVPIADGSAPSHEQLADINRWLGRAGGAEPVVYIHCEGGLGRSPTVAVALLMQRGYTRAEAHRFVMTVRSASAPSGTQQDWLEEVEDLLGGVGRVKQQGP